MIDPISLEMPVLMRILVATLAGAMLCLDRILIQVMLSRPIVVASISGLILGNLLTGLTVGALIEIFWINKSPLGTFVPPNDSAVSIVTAITAITLGANQPLLQKELLTLSILIYLPVGLLSQNLEPLTARFNEMVSDKAIQETESENWTMKNITPIRPILIYFIYNLSLIIVPLMFGLIFLPWIYNQLPSFAQMALFYTYYSLPLIGVAVVLSTTQHKKAVAYFSIIFLTFTIFMEIFN